MNNKKRSNQSGASGKIIASLAYLILGFFMVLSPSAITHTICYVLGTILIVFGLFNILIFFIRREMNLYSGLILGIIATAFGIFTLFSAELIIRIIPLTLGIIIVIDSLIDIADSLQLKALGMKRWWIKTAIAVIVLLLGLSFIFFSGAFGKFLMIILGIVLIYKGIAGFLDLALKGHYAKKSSNNDRIIDVDANDIDDD